MYISLDYIYSTIGIHVRYGNGNTQYGSQHQACQDELLFLSPDLPIHVPPNGTQKKILT